MVPIDNDDQFESTLNETVNGTKPTQDVLIVYNPENGSNETGTITTEEKVAEVAEDTSNALLFAIIVGLLLGAIGIGAVYGMRKAKKKP